MPKLYSSKQIIKTLKRKGFIFISQKGSHIKYRKTGKIISTVPRNLQEVCLSNICGRSPVVNEVLLWDKQRYKIFQCH